MSKLVCLDRDGTINKDENYYLGSQDNWKDLVEILPNVIEGIKLLNQNNIPVFIITNQASVAINEHPKFTEDRMYEVNDYIIKKLEEQGAKVETVIACPFVDSTYVEKKQGKYTIDPNYIDDNCKDLKPNTGMVEKAKFIIPEADQIFVIGDRLSDVQVGLNAGGYGILISSFKTIELGDVNKVKHLPNAYVAKNMVDAVNWILKK